MAKPNIVIIGAGPAGLGAAFQLTQRKLAHVTVLEQNDCVGGTAGSFEISGIRVDYGSHRLHTSCDKEIMDDIKTLLGNNLLNRPRHGRIRLQGRWLHFPLNPLDLVFRFPPSFSAGVVIDIMGKVLRKKSVQTDMETFESVLERGLGQTICKNFYFPYACKMWGLKPQEMSSVQALRRISANSMSKMFRKILSGVPVFKANCSGRFFYPVKGFGQISESLYKSAKNAGANFYLNARVNSLHRNMDVINAVSFEHNGHIIRLQIDNVWSTVPISKLLEYLEPSPPSSITQLIEKIEYRAVILIYLVLEKDRFSKFDAHYFPETEILITRLSEPKNYSASEKPHNVTVLCAEIPCSLESPEWNMTDQELGNLVLNSLKLADIRINVPVRDIVTRRIKQAYPVYRRGYEGYFNLIDQWLSNFKNLITFGRQGLFVHDNTHHSLYMAYSAVKCLNENGHFDRNKWRDFRKIFNTHVVED